ncbi:hypothetical protein DVDV_0393 [Desulfovibrio sp. DV]|nr:hypothetical protein DVDV_0393 [Desulfovibrio sp. DV]
MMSLPPLPLPATVFAWLKSVLTYPKRAAFSFEVAAKRPFSL